VKNMIDPRAVIGLVPDTEAQRWHARAIPHNFRLAKSWTQEQAAAWYGVSERTWRRWEATGAPQHVLNRIAQVAKRSGGEHLRYLV
jgi:hypothetical protein